MTKNLGKKMRVGEVFISVGKFQFKRSTPKLQPRREGERDYFTKGKRRYYCEVLGIVETTVSRIWSCGGNPPSVTCHRSSYIDSKPMKKWRFSYLVRILEN